MIDYTTLSKDVLRGMNTTHARLKNQSSLDPKLKILLELRVSQVNACAYCCDVHTREAQRFGLRDGEIAALEHFEGSPEFSDAEKEALLWADALTRLEGTCRVENTNLSAYFSDQEISDISICIALMNSYNRLALSMR